MIKAYFIDLDGTLLDSKDGIGRYSISNENMDAVKAESKKSLIVISTGRPVYCFEKQVKYMDVKYFIAGNGAYIFNRDGELIDFQPIDFNVGQRFIEFAKKNRLNLKVNNDYVVYERFRFSALLIKIYRYKKVSWSKYKEPKEFVKFVLFDFKWKIAKFEKKIRSLFPEFEISKSSKGYFLELTNISANKGKAALKILKIEKIDPKHAAHIGDSLNDAPAMEALGFGITFKDSDSDLWKTATHIADTFKNGGVARVIAGEYQEIKK